MATAFNSPFLFTCSALVPCPSFRSKLTYFAVCTVAARYYLPRKELYAQCLQVATRLAADTISLGSKSISIVQGCLLLAHWNQPARSADEDHTYLFAGLAMRMALELGEKLLPACL